MPLTVLCLWIHVRQWWGIQWQLVELAYLFCVNTAKIFLNRYVIRYIALKQIIYMLCWLILGDGNRIAEFILIVNRLSTFQLCENHTSGYCFSTLFEGLPIKNTLRLILDWCMSKIHVYFDASCAVVYFNNWSTNIILDNTPLSLESKY